MQVQRILLFLLMHFSIVRFLLICYALWPLAVGVHNHALAAASLACKFEFLRESFLCRIADATSSPDRYADAIQTEFSGLEGLATDATEIAPLAQSLTEARLSIDDLVVVVRLSSLKSRTALVEELLMISSETREVARNLQKLFAEIQAAIDVMLAVNEHLLGLLNARLPPASGLAMYCYFIGNAIYSDKCLSSSLRITEAYDRTLYQFRQVLSTLLGRVTQVQGGLDSIEARLGVVRDLVTEETGIILSEKSDILSHVLALLKLPSQRSIKLNAQLRSLREVTRYRTLAIRYVSGTMEGLQELAESMEVLRSMALGAVLVEGVPMEVIVASLSKGIDQVQRAGRPSRPPTLPVGNSLLTLPQV